MSGYFFYGTLCHLPLLDLVSGGEGYLARPAYLQDYRAHWVKGQSFPMLVPTPGGRVDGVFVDQLSGTARARLAFYEGGFDYDLHEFSVQVDAGTCQAQVFMACDPLWHPGAEWDLVAWQDRWGAITLEAAREVMSYFGHETAQSVARRFAVIRSRAASRVRARGDGVRPADMRAHFGAEDVEVMAHRQPYSNFFTMQEQDLSFRQFSGKMSAVVERAGFVGCDAVIVLPYDPVRDRVLVVEQFRMGPHLRGDPHPWTLEAIAGRVDAGETPEDCAHRETMEEAGLTIDRLLPLPHHYPSPGASTEFFYPYLAICDLPDSAARVGGLQQEAEDIRSHVMSFDQFMALIDNGAPSCGPVLLCGLWLALHRGKIRGQIGAQGGGDAAEAGVNNS